MSTTVPTVTPAGVSRPELLFFFSPTSGHSRTTEAHLAQILQRRRNHNTFRLHRIDSTQETDLAHRLGVTETPSILIVTEGRVQAKLSKPRGCAHLAEFLSPWLR